MDKEFRCPRRTASSGSELDCWETIGADRCCSYCGSVHPEDFERGLDGALALDGTTVEPSGKWYKVYINRPGLGGAKFYRQHLPHSDHGWMERLDEKYKQAVDLFIQRFKALHC